MSIELYHELIDNYREWELEFVKIFEEKQRYCLENSIIMSVRLIQECWSPAGPQKTDNATVPGIREYHIESGRIK